MTDTDRPLIEQAALTPEQRAALRDALVSQRTLEQVLDWAGRQRPPRRIAEVVTQDEFTHDVLLALEPPLWLVYDVT